jgi:outer membrane protein assembly factor BamB
VVCFNRDGASVERSGVFRYSMKQDTMVWSLRGINRMISINSAVSGERYYFVTGSDFYCVDVRSGRLVWKRSLNLPLPFRFIDPLTIADGNIFAKKSLGDANCLIMTKGLVIWANARDSETRASGFAEGGRMEYHKGRLYYSDNTMHVIDALFGRLIKNYKAPRSVPQNAENYIEGITIDPETDRMYFTDGYHLICT